MDHQELVHVAKLNGLQPPETFDRKRLLRAEKFAAQIMEVVAPHVSEKNAVRNALVAAAYIADAEIVTKD